jgi:hypothetical protein
MGLKVNVAAVVIFQKIKRRIINIKKAIILKVKVDYLKARLVITLGWLFRP